MLVMENRRNVVGTIVIILICAGFVGWRLYRGPDYKLDDIISDDIISRGDAISLSFENKGNRVIELGYTYELKLEHLDGSTDDVPLELAWPAVEISLTKGESWSQEIFTDLVPGKYNIFKSFNVAGLGEHSSVYTFTVE